MITLALLLAVAQSTPAPSEPVTAAAAAQTPDGRWDGGMTVPAGLTIPFQLDLAGSSGRFAAPDQQVRDVPVTVARDGMRVVVTLPRGDARFEAVLSADGGTLAGTWTRGDQSLPASFKRRGAGVQTTGRVRPQTPVAPFPYAVRDVSVPSAGGVTLAGTLTMPAAAPGTVVPAVLLIGGNGPQTRDETYAGHRPMLVVAARLTRAGAAVFRFDKRGVGGSTGRYAAAGGAELVADARSALAWLRARPGVDPRRVCVLGLSEGAMIAPMVAAADAPACVMLLSPPGVRSARLLGEQTRLGSIDAGASPSAARRDGAIAEAVVGAMARGEATDRRVAVARAAGADEATAQAVVRELDTPEVRIFLTEDPAVALRELSMPVLVLAGTRDHQVAPELNLPPVRSALARNRKARIVLLPGLNHVLQPARTGAVGEYASIDATMDERALSEIVGFVRRTVGTTGAHQVSARTPSSTTRVARQSSSL